MTVTQSTAHGRVWSEPAIAEFITRAHELELVVHMDGSRLANAVASLDVAPIAVIGDTDIITVGGTKNGLLFGEAILVRRPEHFHGIHHVQKQIGHFASKHRYVSAQFEAVLTVGLWLDTAKHANAMASHLAAGLTHLGLQLAWPTEANAVFVVINPRVLAILLQHYALHAVNPDTAVVRFVCSWATQEREVDTALSLVNDLLSESEGSQ